MNFGRIIIEACNNVEPPPDARCSDPAFALSNPALCGVQPRLIIKPGTALLCDFGSIQFSAFVVRNGVEEDVTEDTIFSSGNLNIVVIGAISGNATGIAPGETTITATYEGMTATAQVVVLSGDDCCSQQNVAFMVVMDCTKSMSQAFGGAYATRFTFGLAAADRFIDEIDTTKDLVGLLSFHGTTTSVEDSPTSDSATAAADLAALIPTNDKTEFYDAVEDAIAALNATVADRKVLVIYSDGDDTLTATFNATNDPLILLNDFKAAGGIVMCLGIRASGDGFAMLSAMSTGGFFLNAYPGSEDDALDYFSGLKGYICGGNCTPTGDLLAASGKLNYTGFTNWDVEDGTLDLLGNGFLDFLPGNGLYVDMMGSDLPQTGRLVSKVAHSLLSGHQYRIRVSIAGNQRLDLGNQTLRVRVIPTSGAPYLLDQGIGISDYTQDFQQYSLSFTAPADMTVLLSFNQMEWSGGVGQAIGVLIDSITFEDLTTGTLILLDTFDAENIVYVSPACGTGTTWTWLTDLNAYGYATGYNCYGEGCLDEPPPIQLPDPNALGNIESGDSPPIQTYTATKTACAECPADSQNNGTPLIPDMTSNTEPSGEASASAIMAAGNDAWRAFQDSVNPLVHPPWVSGVGPPQWLQYKFDTAVIAYGYLIYGLCGFGAAPTAWILQGSNDGVNWTALDTQTSCSGNEVLPIATPAAYTYYRLYITIIEELGGIANACQIFAFQLYGESVQQACATATAISYTSQEQAEIDAYAAAYEDAQAMLSCQHIYTSTQQYTAQCPLGCSGYSVTASATATSVVSQQAADDEAYAAAKASAEADLECTTSTNDHNIVINDKNVDGTPGPATPYPAVKYVTGLTGTITKVTVSVTGLTHTSPVDIMMVLRSPAGTYVTLMRACGGTPGTNAVADVDLVFDDDFAAIGQLAQIVSQTYGPSGYGADVDLPAPADPAPYAATLAQLFGESPNGCWSLWVCDINSLDTGNISNGFDLTITSA